MGMVLLIGIAGPLALPLIWRHPKLSIGWKIGISLGVIALTWILIKSMSESLKMLRNLDEVLDGI